MRGFHSGFIRSTKHRKETREQLITNIRDLCLILVTFTIHRRYLNLNGAVALGAYSLLFKENRNPDWRNYPVSALTLNERNVRLMYSEIFQIKIFSPAISDIQEVLHIFETFELAPTNPSILPMFDSSQKQPPNHSSARVFVISLLSTSQKAEVSPPKVVNNALAASPKPRLIAPTSTNTHLPFDPVHSQLSSMRLSDDDPSPVTPPSPSHSLRTYLGSPNPLVVKLPSDVRDLLAALGIGLPNAVTELAQLQRLRSTLLRSTPPTLVMSTITIPPTSRPGAGTNAPSCSERARKSDEQRAQEKEHKLARKVKIKAAVDVAIDQIDDIIEG
ncbi:hypothetical protein BGW80DRAFT_1250094, partial [Lactifluus volemus]